MSIEEFVKNNKYNDYDYIKQELQRLYISFNLGKHIAELHNIKETMKVDNVGVNIDVINSLKDMFQGYNELNHLYCKKIYENPNNEEMIIKIIKKIYENGGVKAIKTCNRILIFSSPFTKSTEDIIITHLTKITNYFKME